MRRRTGTAVIAITATALIGSVLPAQAARQRSTWQPNTATRWEVGAGGDNYRTGYNPTETTPAFIGCKVAACRGTGDADGPWLEWVTKLSDLPSASFIEAGLVADDGILYIAAAATNSFVALDMKTGLPVWRFAPDPRAEGSTSQYPASNAPVVHNGVVYATFSSGFIYALNAKTGKKIWSYRATDGYRDTKASRPGDANHPERSGLDSYYDDTLLKNRGPFNPVHPGVDYPKINGATALCADQNVVAFMTLAGWAYGIDAPSGHLLWKRYADAPEFPGEMVWPEYKYGGALNPKNSSLGSTTRRFEAVPGVACLNGEVGVAGSDGHARFFDPRTGKQGPHDCGFALSHSHVNCSDNEHGAVGAEYDRLDIDSTGAKVDACAADGFNCDIAIFIGIPPLANSGATPGMKGGDFVLTTLDARLIRLGWDSHVPVWHREYSAPLPFETANTMPLALTHVEDGFIGQAVFGSPMAIDPDVAGQGARPILYAANQDGHLYVISVSELGGGLRTGDPSGPNLLARVGVTPNTEPETPYTQRTRENIGDLGGPWDFNQNALSGLTLGGGVLYVPTWDNKITAFDVRNPATPKQVWQYEVKWDPAFRYPPFGKTYPTPLSDLDNKIFSSPALLGGHLYFASNDGSIYAFNLHHPVKTVRNLVILGSGISPFIPQFTEAAGTYDRVWTPDDWYKNQIAPPGYRLPSPGGVAGAGALIAINLILFWWYRRRTDVSIEIQEVVR